MHHHLLNILIIVEHVVISIFLSHRSCYDEHFYVKTTWGDRKRTGTESDRIELKLSPESYLK